MAEGWSPSGPPQTLIMGVVNVTPDSFSGDGLYGDPHGAAAQAVAMVEAGASILDIGGESTRPGYEPVDVTEELRRVLPALSAIRSRVDVPLSIDTSKATVAREALALGATSVNDVSGLHDEEMLQVVKEAGASLVLVHRGDGTAVPIRVQTVVEGLRHMIERAEAAGLRREDLLVDPGLGIGKTWRDNLIILHDLARLRELELPILVGPSRKGMISHVLGVEPHDRLEGTAALLALSIARGATIVRVHDVRYMVRVARMMDALVRPEG